MRIFNVYGPRRMPGQHAGVISIFAKRALNQQPLEIFGDGSQTPDFIYISDAVDATIAGMERTLKSRVFNIASGTEPSILELASIMRRITESQSKLEFCPAGTGDIARSVADISKARNELGFATRTSLDQGLSATMKWRAQENPSKRAD